MQWDKQTRSSFLNATPAVGGETHNLVAGSNGEALTGAAVSPDGRQLVWSGCQTAYHCDLFLADFSDGRQTGAPRQITHDHNTKKSPLFTNDGQEVIYLAGEEMYDLSIYRVRASDGGEPRRVEGIGANAAKLTLAGGRLVYSTLRHNSDIHRVDLSAAVPKVERFLSSTRWDETPSYSPGGERIAFSSDRDGKREIWVADADGTNLIRLTSFSDGMTNGPKWSPDGQWIAFSARPGGNANIYMVPVAGGPVKRLTDGPAQDNAPTWSPDGKWIYFQSSRTGKRQIFRMRRDGSSVHQMTHQGGFYGVVSPDGKWLYYSIPEKGLRKMLVDGGQDVQVLDRQALYNHFSFVIASQGICAVGVRDKAGYPVVLYPFDGGKARTLLYISHAPQFFPEISPDGRWFLYSSIDDTTYGIELVENFR
jgi:Tol biopolymer transport system component